MLNLFKHKNSTKFFASSLVFCVGTFLVYFLAKDLDVKPCFLSDQVDQIMQGRALWDLKSKALYGPYMSGTNPSAYNLGPLTAAIFGVLDTITQSPEEMRLIAAMMLAASLLLCSLSMVFYFDVFLGTFFFLLVIASKHWWWNWSMLWANTFMLVISFSFLSTFISYVHSPRFYKSILMLALSLYGFHIHISSISLLIPALWLFSIQIKEYRKSGKITQSPNEKPKVLFSLFVCIFAILPYALAEYKNNLENTKSLMNNFLFVQKGESSSPRFLGVYEYGVRLLADYQEIFDLKNLYAASLIGGVLLVFGLVFLFKNKVLKVKEIKNLILGSMLIILSQLLFFVLTKRSFTSSHYMSFSWPAFMFLLGLIVWLPIGCLRVANKHPKFIFLYGATMILWGLWIQKDLQTRNSYVERSHWNFKSMRDSMERICAETPRVHIWELPPFLPYQNFGSTVMEYVVSKGKVSCEFQSEEGDVWVYPEVIHYPGARKQMEDKGLKLVDTLPPKLLLLKKNF